MTTRRKDKPRLCECGGKVSYAASFGRIWSCCLKCTPVTTITLPPKRKAGK